MSYFTSIDKRFDDSQFAYGEHKVSDYKTGPAQVCKGCNRYVSMLEWLPPLEIKISKRKLGDFIFGTYIGFVVSENFKKRFEENYDLKGVDDFKKVDLYYRGSLLNENYYYPNISLTNVCIDLSKIQFENFDEKKACSICQKGGNIIQKINSIAFVNPSKIEEDVFFTTSIGQANVIMSENFKNFIEREKFTNLKLINTLEFKWDSLNPISFT